MTWAEPIRGREDGRCAWPDSDAPPPMNPLEESDELLTERGVKHVVFTPDPTARQWHTWRCHQHDFAQELF